MCDDPRCAACDGVAALEARERDAPVQWWWLSFAQDGVFVGVAIVEARGILSACRRARRLGCNPGGEVLANFLGDAAHVPATDRNRLLTADEARAVNELARGMRP